jgi:archaellum biogenesis ATPase FlaH
MKQIIKSEQEIKTFIRQLHRLSSSVSTNLIEEDILSVNRCVPLLNNLLSDKDIRRNPSVVSFFDPEPKFPNLLLMHIKQRTKQVLRLKKRILFKFIYFYNFCSITKGQSTAVKSR